MSQRIFIASQCSTTIGIKHITYKFYSSRMMEARYQFERIIRQTAACL